MDDRLKDAINTAYYAPSSTQKIILVEEAVRLADEYAELGESFQLRCILIQLCTEYGQFAKALVAFSWCLNRVNNNDEDFSDIIWEYQALLVRAAMFDSVSVEKMDELFQDYRSRMKEEGATDNSYYSARLRAALTMRDEQRATEALKGFKSAKKDIHSDCIACIQNMLIQYELYFGSYEKARKLVQPLIDGKMSCNMVPLRTFAHMVNHVYRAGETALAETMYNKGIKLIGNKGGFLEQIGLYLIYLSYTNPQKAKTLFRKALPWALNRTEMPWSLFHFHMGSCILFTSLNKKTPIKLRVDKKYQLYNEKDCYLPEELAAYHYKTALEYAKRFDSRNKNSAASDMLEQEYKLIKEFVRELN